MELLRKPQMDFELLHVGCASGKSHPVKRSLWNIQMFK
jgi:hypothetical protein